MSSKSLLQTIENLIPAPQILNTVYFQATNIGITDIDVASAYRGFSDISTFEASYDLKILTREQVYAFDLPKGCIFMGGVRETLNIMHRANIKPDILDYPEELKQYLGREVYKKTIADTYTHKGLWFVKPYHTKQFPATLIKNGMATPDALTFESHNLETPIWMSSYIPENKRQAEYRCYVLNNKILDVRRYLGSYLIESEMFKTPHIKVLKDIVKNYKSAPVAYAFDVTEHGQLIEVNDAWSLGNYGMDDVLYAEMIEARWKQLWANGK